MRRHYERFIGRTDTLEERRELVCSECDAVTLVEQTLAPVIHINFDVTLTLTLPEKRRP